MHVPENRGVFGSFWLGTAHEFKLFHWCDHCVVCTLGGYVGAGGHLSVLADAAPLEIVIMGGTAAGGFIIANPKATKSRVKKSMKFLFQKQKIQQAIVH